MRDRFVICRNPEQADRDQAVRDQLVAQLTEAIADSDGLPAEERNRLAARLAAKRGLKRLLRQTPGGLLRVDRGAIRAEAHLDGKFLLRSSDPTLSAEDIALGYKQLLQVERGWRDMKTTLDLRPVHHRKEDRIRAHVQLCWLALLFIRIAENEAGDTWRNLRRELERMHQGTFRGSAGLVCKRSETTAKQRHILTALGLPEPPAIGTLDTTPAATA
jgi:transposase